MDFVSTETIIRLVKLRGHDAVLEGDMLRIYPRDGAPVAYRVPSTGIARRLVIQIGKKCDIKSHWFWNPERAYAPGAAPLSLVKPATGVRKSVRNK